jgi:hypothetical protein
MRGTMFRVSYESEVVYRRIGGNPPDGLYCSRVGMSFPVTPSSGLETDAIAILVTRKLGSLVMFIRWNGNSPGHDT